MDQILQELGAGISDPQQVARVVIRLVASAVVGAIIGLQRQRAHKPAGLRTHMLVALGAAVFVLVPLELHAPLGEVGRVIQGVAVGIGFIGAGTILKLSDRREIKGLTTASSIWLAAAVGTAAGLQGYALAVSGTLLALLVLTLIGRIERYFSGASSSRRREKSQAPESE
jgi:putative Mg2+ transporter-C (MgtC) family protein